MSEGTQQIVTTPEKRAPIVMNERGIQLSSFEELWRFSSAVHESRLAPKSFDSPASIMVAIQMGLEIGLAPMQALQSIAVINGRPSVWGDAALALCVAAPGFVDIQETVTDGVATCTVKRAGRTDVVRTFSMEDAKRAQLTEKPGPWKQYPNRMLQMRARAFALRDAFPDALRGVSFREEVEDIPKQVEARVVATSDLKFADEKEAQ